MEEKQEYYPSILGAISLLLVFNILATIFSSIFNGGPFISGITFLLGELSQLMALCIIILWIKFRKKLSFESSFTLKAIPITAFIPFILAILGLNIILSEVDNLVRAIIPISDLWLEILDAMRNTEKSFWSSVISTAILAPIVEEILFRGLILRGFLKHYSAKKSIIISSLLVAIMYMNPWQFFVILFLGLFIGWCFFKTKSITLCILIHILFNSLGFIVKDILKLKISGYSTGIDIVTFQPLWFDLLGVVLFSVGVILLKIIFRANEKIIKNE